MSAGEKNLVFIVSGGRTGTTFFGDYLSDVIDDCYSEHEPDLLVGLQPKTRKRIARFGIYHMVIGRIFKRTGIRNLAQRYRSGQLDNAATVKAIRRHRDNYHSSIEASLIVESYYAWYGMLGPLRQAYPKARIASVIRDPRDWVRSWINYGGFYNHTDHIRWFGQSRINPTLAGDLEVQSKWAQMGHFEKTCWNWNLTYSLISEFSNRDDAAKLFRFEDLFLLSNNNDTLESFMNFVTQFSGRNYNYDAAKLSRKPSANQSKKTMPSWTEWSSTQARQMDKLCGALMRAYGYGFEAAWQEKLMS